MIAPALHAHTFKHSTKCSLFIYHYKKQPVKHMEKKHTALFNYVVKSVLFSVITVEHCEVMQNILFYVDIVREGNRRKEKVNNILAFKYHE